MRFERQSDERDEVPTRDKGCRDREALRAFLKANDKELCESCGCCEMGPRVCWNCGGDGVTGHDCGEDTCCCLDPEDNEPCDVCDGAGCFKACIGCCGGDQDCG